MDPPPGFTWIDKPLLAGMAQPESSEDLLWLRQQGIEVLISLSEERPPRVWVNEAGLLLFHEPIQDMDAPTQDQLERIISAIHRAITRNMGVAVHCTAGLGRTGSVLSCYLIAEGQTAENAIARIRRLRPGSIETEEQADAVVEFARRRRKE